MAEDSAHRKNRMGRTDGKGEVAGLTIEKGQKKSYTLFRVWLILLAAVILFYMYGGRGYFPLIGAGKNLGIIVLVFLDVLFVMILATQSVYWISGVSYEAAKEAGASARRRFALWHLAIFLVATVLFLIYCFGMKGILLPDQTRDSLVAGGTVCAAVVASSRVRLQA